MFLTYDDLVKLYPKVKGVSDPLQFFTVSTAATICQPRGLFIPVFVDSGELKYAIQNGAIAAIWEENVELPSYVPSQFPVFFTTDMNKALETILNTYTNELIGDKNEMMNMTKFLFTEDKLLNETIPSYDKPVIEFVRLPEGRE